MSHDDKTPGGTSSAKTTAASSRETRLAKALRANLRKRKAQARARRSTGDRPPGDETPGQT
ncbi:MAG: hypothetical protein ACLFPA_03685 [Dichotomicrobium sp.]